MTRIRSFLRTPVGQWVGGVALLLFIFGSAVAALARPIVAVFGTIWGAIFLALIVTGMVRTGPSELHWEDLSGIEQGRILNEIWSQEEEARRKKNARRKARIHVKDDFA